MSQSGALVLIMAVAVLAPLLAYGIGRWLPVPLVVFEILLGIVVGPDVLGWAGDGQVIVKRSARALLIAMALLLSGRGVVGAAPASPVVLPGRRHHHDVGGQVSVEVAESW